MIKKVVAKSGPRYQVRVRGADGKERSKTHRTLKEAERYEREFLSGRDRGTLIDPRLASETLNQFTDRWLVVHGAHLRPRTLELYRSLLHRHILPRFGALPLGKIATGDVRAWNAELALRVAVTAAKAYRLLSQIMKTAVEDGLIVRNPCVVRGAGLERSPERPVVSVQEAEALAQAMPDRLRLAIYLAAWCQLRHGEILGLERRDVDLLHGSIRIERTVSWPPGGMQLGPPKTQAGVRTVYVPPNILDQLKLHMEHYAGAEADAPVFVGQGGSRLRPASLDQSWRAARLSIGRPEVHFHDLRHSGATWLAVQGATTKEIMARVGHASPQAALRYQHATEDRDAALARLLGEMAETVKVAKFPGHVEYLRNEAS
ncbi:MAG: site-specific integrase [Actinomycetota bacterium]|nr:site-specific integrase [Actinomycetota bacterium]